MSEEQENLDDDLYEHLRIEVDPGQDLTRIDVFLMARIQNATRNKIQNAIKDGFVKVNEQTIKPNYKTKPGDVITISGNPAKDGSTKMDWKKIILEDGTELHGGNTVGTERDRQLDELEKRRRGEVE